MVTLGTDAHKWSHTIVATDEQGRQVGQVRVKATPEGHLRALGGPTSGRSGAGRSRTAGTCHGGWSGACWPPGSQWCGCRPG
jgi:hypothetical protein